MMTGNIGEWSEVYTFLKLLGEGKLYAADENLNRLEEIYYPIISILREESKKLEYKRNGSVRIIDGETNELLKEIPFENFSHQSDILLKKIRTDGNTGGSFSYPEVEDFLKEIEVTRLKANSTKKEDIVLIVHDFRTGLTPTLGFSIKSQLGGASTLLNPSNSTNFTYKVSSPTDRLKENSSDTYDLEDETIKLRERLHSLYEDGYKFDFIETGNDTFTQNLRMIDSQLPELLAHMLLYYYCGRGVTVKELTEILKDKNPLEYQVDTHKFYEHKIKRFLVSAALGMTPAKPWEGDYLASGGYIVVKEDGELVCYHIYNVNQFENYLFNNTKLETPSTGRFGFGDIYSESSTQKIKLNLQIRFVK